MSKTRQISRYCNLLMVMYGVSSLMFGTALPELLQSFTLSMARGGLIVTIQSVGGLAAALAGIMVGDRLPKGRAVAISFVALGGSLIFTGLSGQYSILLSAFFLAGLCQRILDTMLNAIIGDIRQDRRGFYMNMLHLFFGIGAFLGPMFARALFGIGLTWRHLYLFLGLVYLLAGVPGFFILGSIKQGGAGPGTKATRSPGITGAATLLGLCLLFYVMHQSGVSAWFPVFFEAVLGTGADFASVALSIYWVGIILSRLISSHISNRVKPVVMVPIGAIAGGTVLVLGLLIGGPIAIAVTALITGVLTGSIIPLCLAVAHEWYSENTGSVTSLMAAFMLAGRLVAPWLMGAIGDKFGLMAAMYLTVAALWLSAVSISAARRSRRIARV